MSDSNKDIQPQANAIEQVAPGESLRQAREAAGLHIAALAVMLKVPVKKLEALESGRFDLLADAVFVRALAASVCRTLKIDPTPILAQLPATSSPKLQYRGTGINEEFRASGNTRSPSAWAYLSKPAALAGLALVLGALVLIFLPAVKQGLDNVTVGLADFAAVSWASAGSDQGPDKGLDKGPDRGPDQRPDKGSDSGAGKPDAAAVYQDSNVNTPASTSPADAQKANAATAAQPPPGVSAVATETPGSGPSGGTGTSAVSRATSSGTVTASDIVVFTATGESWVEATDAKGRVVLRRMLMLGDVVGAAGSLPLKIVVGKANATQVQIRGEGFDLGAVSKDNVARFEVK